MSRTEWRVPAIKMHEGMSKASEQLIGVVTRKIAHNTLRRQVTGYPKERQAAAVPPATTNAKGCWLARAKPNRAQHGYIAVRPFVPRSGRRVKNGTARTKRRSQHFVHRLAVLAWGTEQDIERMIRRRIAGEDWEVSHLCGNPTCFNPDHIKVESHSQNEQRKHLDGKLCRCVPACI